MALTSPNGTPLTVRPIQRQELDRMVLRCWPDLDTIGRLFDTQGTIGMAAWEGDQCVAQLHTYRVMLPEAEDWAGAGWWAGGDRFFAKFGEWGPRKRDLGLDGPAWCHACFHVGRTLATFCAEVLRKFVLPEADEHNWNDDRIAEELRTHVSNATGDLARQVLDGVRAGDAAFGREHDERYFGRGIGTALCEASVCWARAHDYVAVLAPGAPSGMPEFTKWAGHLPGSTYAKLGFRACEVPPNLIGQIPGWAEGKVHEPIASEVKAALATRPVHDILERLMVLDLGSSGPTGS